MGALRNLQYITVFYLLANDEIVLPHERAEYDTSIESYMNIITHSNKQEAQN